MIGKRDPACELLKKETKITELKSVFKNITSRVKTELLMQQGTLRHRGRMKFILFFSTGTFAAGPRHPKK